jgi:hypothetical protein
VFNVYGSRAIPAGPNSNFDLGLSFQMQTGVPITALGYNVVYGNGYEIPLAARGAGGERLADGTVVPGSFKRGPTLHQVGLHADYNFHLGGQSFGAVMRVFNLFNEQRGTDFDNGFELNGPGDNNPDFGKAVTFEAPRSFQFALRANF